MWMWNSSEVKQETMMEKESTVGRRIFKHIWHVLKLFKTVQINNLENLDLSSSSSSWRRRKQAWEASVSEK